MLGSKVAFSLLLLRKADLWFPVYGYPAYNRVSVTEKIFRTSMSSAPIADDDVQERKKTLRKEIRSKLAALTTDLLQQESRQVWERLFELDVYKNAQSIGVFLSMPKGEIWTDPLLLDAAAKGKHIYVPQVGKNFEKCDMDLVRVAIDNTQPTGTLFHHAWPKNKWQIPEPPSDCLLHAAVPGDLDLLVVPGLAFDIQGNRLGQGKGYYDRFISRMLNANVKHPVLVAAGLDC
jgi:5-formyltetrahydrofolate cyclo-ligase